MFCQVDRAISNDDVPSYPQGKLEQIQVLGTSDQPSIDADVLFIPTDPRDRASNRTLSELMKSPLWQKLKVVQQEKVYSVGYHIWQDANLFVSTIGTYVTGCPIASIANI